jgi:hypothetical protein
MFEMTIIIIFDTSAASTLFKPRVYIGAVALNGEMSSYY